MSNRLILATYWQSYGDELSRDAQLMFHYYNSTHRIVRVFPLEPHVRGSLLLEDLARGIWSTLRFHMIEVKMSGEDDEIGILAMTIRAARIMTSDMGREFYTRTSLVQGLSNLTKGVLCCRQTDWEKREVSLLL